MKYVIIVDMQNDFIDGSLGTPEAQAIVEPMCEYLKSLPMKGTQIFCTRDTHDKDYLTNTLEGKMLPVEHCIKGTHGWQIHSEIEDTLSSRWVNYFDKETFGSKGLFYKIVGDDWIGPDDEFVFMGVCTDICVVSNALMVRAAIPNVKITVMKDLCAGTSVEAHEAALKVMQSCQIEVV